MTPEEVRSFRAGYRAGRLDALSEVLSSALRVRGTCREGGPEGYQDEHEDGVKAAAGAIVAFIRGAMRRQWPRGAYQRR